MKDVADLTPEQLEAAEERYVDDLEMILKEFASTLEFDPANPGDALNLAIENVKNPEVRRALMPLDSHHSNMIESFSGMVNAIDRHLSEHELYDRMAVDLKVDLDYLRGLKVLANNALCPIGDTINNAIGVRDYMTKDQVQDIAYQSLVESLAMEDDPEGIKRSDVPRLVKEEGRRALTYGLAMLRGTPVFDQFSGQARGFKNSIENAHHNFSMQ